MVIEMEYINLKNKPKLLNEAQKLFAYTNFDIDDSFSKNIKKCKIIYLKVIDSLCQNIENANNNNGIIRTKYQNTSYTYLSDINLLNSYFYDLKIINNKDYLSVCKIIDNCRNILKEWIKESSDDCINR